MTGGTKAPSISRRTFGAVFTILGILMGSASLISLVQRWTGIELISEIARDALSLYRQMMEQIHWALFDWWTPIDLPWGWTFEMPMWGMDILTVWSFAIAASYRVVAYQNYGIRLALEAHSDITTRLELDGNELSVDHLSIIFLAPYFLVAEIIGYIAASNLSRVAKEHLAGMGLRPSNTKRVLSTLTMVFLATAPFFLGAGFFVWNAIQITPQ